MKWFRAAGEQGNGAAQFRLAVMFRLGLGVPVDEVKAHVWYNLSGVNGVDESRIDRNDLEKKMTKKILSQRRTWQRPAFFSAYIDCGW